MQFNTKIKDQYIWVIVPALNEAAHIGTVLAKTKKITPQIIVVDDGSRDQTSQIAYKYTAYVLTHKVNLGKGAALKTGCEYAFNELHAQAVVLMDADDQHDPLELPHFFSHLAQGHQVVLGTRNINEHMPFWRSFGNLAASCFIRFFFGVYIVDIPSGYKAFTKQAYRRLKWASSNYAVEMEIATRIGKNRLDYVSLPIATIYQKTDKGMTMLDILSMFWQVLNWRFSL